MLRIFASILALFVLTVLGTGASAASISGADHGGRPMTTTLLGATEVNAAGEPNQGDPDGVGTALVTFNLGQGEVCFEITTTDIATPTRGHIHAAPAGKNGAIVVEFFEGNTTPGTLSGCTTDVDRALILDILQNPQNYYVNVHNADFPGGALRGQLG